MNKLYNLRNCHFTLMRPEFKGRAVLRDYQEKGKENPLCKFASINEALESIRKGEDILAAFMLLTKHLRSGKSHLFSLQELSDTGITPVILQYIDPSSDPVTLEVTMELVDYLTEASLESDSPFTDPVVLRNIVDVMMGPFLKSQMLALNIARNLLTDEAVCDSVFEVFMSFDLPMLLFRGNFFDRERSEIALREFDDLPCSPLTSSLGLLEALLERIPVEQVTPELCDACLTLIPTFLHYDPDQRFSLLIVIWKLIKVDYGLKLLTDELVPELLIQSLNVCHDDTVALVYRDIACFVKRGVVNEMFVTDDFIEKLIHFMTCGDTDTKLEILRLLDLYRHENIDVFRNAILLESIVDECCKGPCKTRTRAALFLSSCMNGPCIEGNSIVNAILDAIQTIDDTSDLVQVLLEFRNTIDRGGEWADILQTSETFRCVLNELSESNPDDEIQALLLSLR